MGACLDIQTSAAPFALEVRRESFYIGTGLCERVLHARRGANGIPAAFSVPREYAAAFLAGLDQVLAHYPRKAESPAKMAKSLRPLLDPWTVHVMSDMVVVQGPAIVFVDTKWTPADCVEIEYAHLNHLRAALAVAVEA